jgi:hypothetical protein
MWYNVGMDDFCTVLCGPANTPEWAKFEDTRYKQCDFCGAQVVVSDSTIDAAKSQHKDKIIKLTCVACLQKMPKQMNFNNLSDKQLSEISKKMGLPVDVVRMGMQRIIDVLNKGANYEQN